MALVTHKYMVGEIPIEELRSTFAAREHTLDYLVDALRKQSQARTLTSYLVTGPRGAGKTTILRMLGLRIREDNELSAAWLPVCFPEELPGVASLRDLLATTLERLADQGVDQARDFRTRVEAEANDEQSEGIAIGALRQISEREGKRLILFIENLDQMFTRAIDDRSAGTFRRLLMVEPFMMVVGTAVRQFEALQRYDKAFFNYFCPVPLERLDDRQVRELLFCRAEFDGNKGFAERYNRHQAKIRAITRLTGGNPRLIMMLYEVLNHGDFCSVVNALRELVDGLTPLLKDILDNQLSDQQTKMLDAIMRAGGTSTPAEIARATRIPLNSTTRQLQRLKEMHMVDLLGGGKGREAYYTVPDPLFRTWYQMRYLRPHRRRIELFVEMLEVWFEVEKRLTAMRDLANKAGGTGGKAAMEAGTAIEYFGASLASTAHAKEARELVVGTWLRLGHIDDAAMALAESIDLRFSDRPRYEAVAYSELATWADEHGDLSVAVAAARAAVQRAPDEPVFQGALGAMLMWSGDYRGAIECYDRIVQSSRVVPAIRALAMYSRGACKSCLGDTRGAIDDYSALVALDGVSTELVAKSLYYRAVGKRSLGDPQGAVDDYSAVIALKDGPADVASAAFVGLGMAMFLLGRKRESLENLLHAIEEPGAESDIRVAALKGAFPIAFVERGQEGFDAVAVAAVAGTAKLTAEERGKVFAGVLRGLAQHDAKELWPGVLQSLRAHGPADVQPVLEFFQPVADVLESGDASRLDPLPPEQREFALQVLRLFEDKERPAAMGEQSSEPDLPGSRGEDDAGPAKDNGK